MKVEQIKILKKYILSGDFKEARKVARTFELTVLGNELLKMAFDTENIAIYFFLQDWLSDEESAELHRITSILLSVGLVWIPGANYLAMHHLEKAIKLSPNNVDYKKAMLTFFEVPERPISNDKAMFYAKQVLDSEPENSRASEVLDSIQWRNEKAKEAQKILENLEKYEVEINETGDEFGYMEVFDKSKREIWVFRPDQTFDRVKRYTP